MVLRTPKRKYWELPGGRIDYAEKAEHAFKREMREELGFKKVKLGKFINIWSFISKRDGVNYHFIILDFIISTNETEIKLSKEHTEYKWVGLKDINKIKMRAGHKASIRKFFKTV